MKHNYHTKKDNPFLRILHEPGYDLCVIGLVISFIADLVHKGTIKCRFILVPMNFLFSKFSLLGLDYDAEYELLLSNYAVVIAVVSVVLAAFPILFREKKEQTFGIRRDMFTSMKNPFSLVGWILYIMILIPFLMLVSVVFKFCIMGYYLMVLTFIGMFLVFWFYNRDHLEKYVGISKAVEIFFSYTTGEECGYYSKNITDYRLLLYSVSGYIARENGWNDAGSALKIMLENSSPDISERQRFVTVHLFVRDIYKKMCEQMDNCLTYLMEIYKESLMKMNLIFLKERDENQLPLVYLWAVLSAAQEWDIQEDIVRFIGKYCVLSETGEVNYPYFNDIIDQNGICKANIIVLVFIECWQNNHTGSSLSQIQRTLDDMWTDAYKVINSKNDLIEKINKIVVVNYEALYGRNTPVASAFKKFSVENSYD